jgi:hypothetical protein
MRLIHETIVAVEKQKILHISLRGHAWALVRACMWLPGRVDVCMRIRAYSLANPARNAYAPCCDVNCDPSVSTTFFDVIS